MTIGVLALVGVTPERLAMLTNGRGGLRGDEMAVLPKPEMLCAVGAGSEAVDLATAQRRGIMVVHGPDANAPAVADSALMLLLAATRHLLEADRFVRAGGWQEHWRVETPTITGKRLGMLGLGKIGSSMAQRAAGGFAMAIGSHTRTAVAGAPYRSFARLLALATWADCLVAAAPGGAGTRHLINAEVLAALGPHGSLVNVGRGTVVDTQALLDALRAQRLAGAGLDVLEGEPSVPPLLPELLQCDNVVVTPHVAGRAPGSRTAATAMMLANLNAHCAGQPLPSLVASTA